MTTGKIFSDSSNIYQDQARLLYAYYEQAARRIVQQEEAIEKQISQLEEDRAAVELRKSDIWKWFLTIIAFFMYWVRKSQYDKQLALIDRKIEEKRKEHAAIFRDYKVTRLGVAYVPVARQVAYEDKCFVVDYTDSVAPSHVSLQMSRQNDLLIETITQMEKLTTEAPIIETSDEPECIDTNDYSLSIQEANQCDYIGRLDRSIRTISYCMNDTEVKSVDLPLVSAESGYLGFLNEYATNDTEGHTIVRVFDDTRYDDAISDFCKINELKDSVSSETEQFEDVLKHLMHTMAASVQTISAMKLASTDKVVTDSNNLLLRILKAPYNHYSPFLEAEEIRRIRDEKFDYSDSVQGYEPFRLRESSRVRYNLFADEWTAEDNSSVSVPFGVHQIYEEIMAPMVQRLMMENRVERLRIYSQIHDQKISYLNKWHQDVDAFYRSNHAESADIINDMQHTLSEYVEAYNTLVQLQKTLDSMSADGATLDSTVVAKQDNTPETLTAFEMQAQEFRQAQEEFSDYMDRLQEDIALKAEKFGHVEFYDARLQDGYSNTMAVAAGEVHSLDERRKPLAATNPLLAKESVLLPPPSVESITYEHLSLNLPSLAVNALDTVSRIAVGNPQSAPADNDEPDTADSAAAASSDETPSAPAPENNENKAKESPKAEEEEEEEEELEEEEEDEEFDEEEEDDEEFDEDDEDELEEDDEDDEDDEDKI